MPAATATTATLIITACLIGEPPDEQPKCDPPFAVPGLEMTMQECVLFGQQAALEVLGRYPYFEFMELREWRCEVGEQT